MARIERICEICKSIFIVTKKSSAQRTCSLSCGRRLQWQSKEYREYQSELMKKRSKDPKLIESRNKAAIKTITHYNQHREDYPDGVERHREAARRNITKRNNDPEFKESHRLRMIERNKDPEFIEKRNISSSNTLKNVNKRRSNGEFPNRQKTIYNKLLESYKDILKYNHLIYLDELKDIANLWYMVDIAIPTLKLVIEVDGWSHKKKQHIESDRLRDFNLARLGWKIMRVRHEDIDEDLSAVVIKINEWICSSQSG